MDGHKVVAFSAAVVTLWGIYRLLESSTRGTRRGAEKQARSTAPPPPTPQKVGTLPTPPTPASQILSPASVPTLHTPPSVPEHSPDASTATQQRAAPPPVNQRAPSLPPARAPGQLEPTEARMPETPISKTPLPSLPVKPKETHQPAKKESHEAKHDASKESTESNNNHNKRALKPSGKKQPASLEVSADSRVERIDCETLASWLTKGEHPILVDVRTDNYKGGHITGAKHLSYSHYQTGKDFLEELKPTKAQKIIFICMYGKEQSPAAAQDFLVASDSAQELQVYVLHGGFQAWLRYCARADLSAYISEYNQDFWVPQDGGLVYRADIEDSEPSLQRAPSLRHMRMQSSTLRLNLDENHRYELLDPPTLGLWLASNDKPVLVDVRSEDFKGGHIARAMHIPFASFSTRIGEVQAALRENTGERKNVVVFYCLFGDERSPTAAMKFLTKHTDPSTKVYVLRRGFQEWLNFCLQTTPMSADRVVDYDPEKWVRQDKLGYVYKSNYSA